MEDLQYKEENSQIDSISNSSSFRTQPQTLLEKNILQQLSSLENLSDFQRNISQELSQKIKSLEEMTADKNQEEVLNLRMHQLAIAKILVFTHGRHQFRLVQAHGRLAEAYIDFQCYQQAIEHLLLALKKNSKIHSEIPETRIYHGILLTLLGKAYLQNKNFQGSLQALMKAFELKSTPQAAQFQVDKHKTLMIISDCYTRTQSYENALKELQTVVQLLTDKQDKKKDLALVYSEIAKVYSLQKNFSQAELYQNKAIQVFFDINYKKLELVADHYVILSGYQQKLGNINGVLESLKKIKDIQKYLGPVTEKSIKIRQKFAFILTKNARHEEALSQFNEVAQLQQKAYGQFSLKVAKTYKMIGTINYQLGKMSEALSYWRKAMKINEQNGMKKAADQLKKLISTKQNQAKRNES